MMIIKFDLKVMISFFKELFWLIGQLFTKVDASDMHLTVKKTKHFPFQGYSYMFWCGYLLSTKKNAEQISDISKNHERIHRDEAFALGYKYWFQYYWRYVIEWIKGNPIIAPASSAYFTTPFEMEAYANQRNKAYKPTKETFKKYIIKDRKKTYKENRHNWLKYIESI